jgi:hypothetical protein
VLQKTSELHKGEMTVLISGWDSSGIAHEINYASACFVTASIIIAAMAALNRSRRALGKLQAEN